MEPLNDKELNELLRQWDAPGAPPSLVQKFFPRPERLPWWRWLWNGTIRVPVPIGLAALVFLVLSVLFGFLQGRSPSQPPRTGTLADFQPVKQLQPRIIRSGYDAH